MKKAVITLALLAVAATSAFAQLNNLTVGAGYHFYTQVTSVEALGATFTTEMPSSGFYLGASYKVCTFGPGIDVTPGLYFTKASYKDKDDSNIQMKEGQIAIPILFSYTLNLVPGTLSIAPYVGPTLTMGFSKKSTVDNWKHTSDFYAQDNDYRKTDLALGAGFSIDIMNLIAVNFGYNHHLFNMYKGDTDGISYKHGGTVYFGVSYGF